MQRPPAKRRKLSNHMPHSQWAEFHGEVGDSSRAFDHTVETVEEEQLAQEGIRGTEEHQARLPRQDAAMSSAATTAATMAGTSASSASSISSIAPASGTVSGVATGREVTASEATPSETTAATTGEGLALSVLLQASVSLPLSEIVSIATSVPVSVVSGVLSDVSSLLAPSETSSTTSSISANETTSAATSSSMNTTTPITSSASVTSSIGNSTTSSSILSSSTSTGFLTSSFSRNSTTTASSISSSSTSEESSSSSSSTESALAFIATLSQGDVTTLSRSPDAYTTVLDGSTLTVSAAETSSLSRASRTTDIVSMSASSADASSSNARQTTSTIAGTESEASTTFAAPASTESASNKNSNSGGGSSTPPAGTIAGGVVGGAAGLALVALIAMLAVRWYRRKGVARHRALPQGPGDSPNPGAMSSSGPGMAERAGLAPLAAAVPAMFRNQNRNAEGGEMPQRGFTRVAGRKLPSAFSGGTADLPANRDMEPDLNETSFYRDSGGFYGGSGGSPPSESGSFPLRSNSYEHMTISPGPQRTPRLHSGGPYNMSPSGSAGPSSPHGPPPLSRSDAPFLLDPNRNSRFSEGL